MGRSGVYVDVSAMSRMLIVQLIVAVTTGRRGCRGVKVLYTEAEEYPPSREEVQAQGAERAKNEEVVDSYISSGVWELAAVPELSAFAAQAEAVRLVVFPSFNPAQLRLLLQELQPTFVDLVNGVPPGAENSWRTDAIQEGNVGAIKGLRNVTNHQTSTLDYRETLRLILALYDERSAFDKVVCAPSGSKMQSVAVGLARTFLTDTQIVYPTPQEFLEPRRHTVGAKQVYQLDLEGFGMVE